jgi:hypothetical protein
MGSVPDPRSSVPDAWGGVPAPGAGRGSRWSGRRLLVLALLGCWAAGLLIAGAWSAHHHEATVREQSSLEQGWRTLDEAVDTVVAAAGSGVSAEVAAADVTDGCRVTVARSGTAVNRTVLLTVPAGQEPALLDRLAERLPAEWRPLHYRGSSRLVADAGEFVSVTGEVAEPGQVEVTVRTGCRPG